MSVNRPMHLLVIISALVFLTSSFDIFLNINIGPNIRIAQLLSLVLVGAALLIKRIGTNLEVPLGCTYLIVWWSLQAAFIPVAEFWLKSAAYCVWLALDIALCFAMVALFAWDFKTLQIVLKLYLLSYVFVAAFGIVQFVLPIMGGPGLLVEQWWLPGRVPRVNGFSYEPSYLATYLIMGLVSLGSLRRSRLAPFRGMAWTCAYCLLIVALLVCFSRMGIIFALIELSIAPINRIAKLIRHPRALLGLRISAWKILACAAAVLLAVSALNWTVNWYREDPETAQILVSGTGLLGTAAHSVDEREDRFHGTLQTIADHPWMGQSLGGITESIAGLNGVRPQNFEEAKIYEGQSVFAEVVAASGIVGSIPFFCFVVVTISSPLRLARRSSPIYAAWLRALVLALVFEWAILELNQNILRMYLWVHIALLCTVFSACRRQYVELGNAELDAAGYGSPNLLA